MESRYEIVFSEWQISYNLPNNGGTAYCIATVLVDGDDIGVSLKCTMTLEDFKSYKRYDIAQKLIRNAIGCLEDFMELNWKLFTIKRELWESMNTGLVQTAR